jgi:hypothetical protein
MSNEFPQAATTETPAREAVTVEGIMARVEELRGKTLMLLGDADRLVDNYHPVAITALLPEDRKRTATTYGRLLFMNTSAGNPNECAARAKKIIIECDRLLESASDKDQVRDLVTSFAEFSAFLMAGNINHNSAGSGFDRQIAMREHLATNLDKIEDTEAKAELYNPFHLESGMTLFRRNFDGTEIDLEEIRLGDILMDGKDSVTEIEGETFKLESINRDLAGRRLMLRDGSNVIGNIEYPAYYETLIKEIVPGKKVSITFPPTPFEKDNTHVVEFLGTNEEELRERYGSAYLPLAGRMILVRFRFEGNDLEWPLGQIKNIEPAKD